MASNPPPRPDQERPTVTETARREQILRGAIVTVNEIGYHRASLAEIARRAGVAKSALMYYFGSKDALMLHVVDEVFGDLGARVEAAACAPQDPIGRLRAYAESYLAHVLEHRAEVAAALDIVLSHRGVDGVPLYQMVDEEDTALLRAILREGLESGVFRARSLDAAVSIAEGLLDVMISSARSATADELTALSREIQEFLLRGLGAEPDTRTAGEEEELPRLDSNQQPAG